MFGVNPGFQNCKWALLLFTRYHQTECTVLRQIYRQDPILSSVLTLILTKYLSFIPSSVRAWNSYDKQMALADSLSCFKNSSYLVDITMFDYSSQEL